MPAPPTTNGSAVTMPVQEVLGPRPPPQQIVKEWRKRRARARYRLLSIERDFKFVEKVVALSPWPVLANQRAGSWYAHPLLCPSLSTTSCYFKSTDGHVGTWAFSLKRLNLQILDVVSSRRCGGCFIVDASKSKTFPDSFSRTIPIWCAVINESVVHLAKHHGIKLDADLWGGDTQQFLFTPPEVISNEERREMLTKVDGHLTNFLACCSIDEEWLLRTVRKPLRPYWICNNNEIDSVELPCYDANKYNCLVCISCSNSNTSRSDVPWYTAGAADDDETCLRGLTPALFWDNRETILADGGSDGDTDRIINVLVKQAKKDDEEWYHHNGRPDDAAKNFSKIGKSGIAIGTRRAGRPPECWDHFDVVLNVTTMEYDGFGSGDCVPPGKAYLCCPVAEGKKDKYELERWLAVAIVFVATNLVSGRKVLIHCAQGMDRSVAIAMAVCVIFCTKVEGDDLALLPWFQEKFSSERIAKRIEDIAGPRNDEPRMYKFSGMSEASVDALMGREGKELLLSWVREERVHVDSSSSSTAALADKDSLRQILHLITRYHERAAPTRSTLQKLNRFFMSSEYENLK
jgi:tRNA A64-2'-O-ribosylphosphate transferase